MKDLMSENRTRVLYISSIPLINETGGSALMYNHLVGKHFQVYDLDERMLSKPFSSNKWLTKIETRLQNSRLYYWVQTCRHLTVKRLIDKKELEEIKRFKPEVVITVAHGELFWLAMKVAKNLKLPLISVFHDWWPELCDQDRKYPSFYRKVVDFRFKSLHKKSACSLCITDAMMNELGPNNRSEVIFPCTDTNEYKPTPKNGQTVSEFKIVYAGNLMKNYGKSLQQLILTMPEDESVNLTILGNTWDWPADMVELGRKKGILKPPVYGKEFMDELSTASAFLVVLDFDKDLTKWTTTLFPSKIPNYAKYNKPILLWGPSYSTGAKFLDQHKAGIVVDKADAKYLWKEIITLKNSDTLQKFYSVKAKHINEELLNPVAIQEKFVHIVKETVNK